MAAVFERYQSCVRELKGAGYLPEEAQLAARLLLDRVYGRPYAHLHYFDGLLNLAQEADVAAMLARLTAGEPLAYVLGDTEFFDVELKCSQAALIPRPETETLVATALQQLLNIEQPRAADLGTGSGCIAIALAHSLPQVQVTATDISAAALELARRNAALNKVQRRVRFVAGQAGQWAAPLLAAGLAHHFDVVVANPPYIASGAIEGLQIQIRAYEPRRALDGGDDGLQCYRALAAQCQILLRPRGLFMAELGAGQYAAVRALFAAAGWTVRKAVPDAAGHERVLVADCASKP